MSRYRITVDQAAIEAGEPAIHVHDTLLDIRCNYSGELRLLGSVSIVQGAPQQDGARVWVASEYVLAENPCI